VHLFPKSLVMSLSLAMSKKALSFVLLFALLAQESASSFTLEEQAFQDFVVNSIPASLSE